MNTSDKVLMYVSIALVVIVILLFGVRVVFAESVCDNPYAENYGQPGKCTWGGMLPGFEWVSVGLCLDPNNPEYGGADYIEYLQGIGVTYYDVCGWNPQEEEPEPEPEITVFEKKSNGLPVRKPVFQRSEPENAL